MLLKIKHMSRQLLGFMVLQSEDKVSIMMQGIKSYID